MIAEATAVECAPKRLKKKRRRRLSRSKSAQDGTTSEYTNESSDDEVSSDPQESTTKTNEIRLNEEQSTSGETETTKDNLQPSAENGYQGNEESTSTPSSVLELIEDTEENKSIKNKEDDKTESIQMEEVETEISEDASSTLKYDLKPDAEEFVPRAYRGQEIIPMEPNIHFIKIPSNFVPLPIINPVGDFNGQSFNAFIPPGIPINFIPQNFVNFIPNVPPKIVNEHTDATLEAKIPETDRETVEVPKTQIDIAKIVSKLEEAAKDQDDEVPPKENEGLKNTTKTVDKRNNFNRRNFRRARNLNATKNNEATNSIQKTPEKQTWKRSTDFKDDKESIQLSPKPAIRNYSDTLKKPQTVLIFEEPLRNLNQQQLNKTAQKKLKDSKEMKTYTLPQTNSRPASEWVSVTNRKKRKNKNVEELEEIEIQSIEESLQEVNLSQICDVIEKTETLPESEPEVPISSLVEVQIATSSIDNSAIETSIIIETEIESSIIETTEPSTASEPQIETVVEEEIIAKTAPIPVLLLPKDTKFDKPKNLTKKKSKKSIKLPIKRVIITDIDLSLNVTPEEKTPKVIITDIDLSANNILEDKTQEVVKSEESIPSQVKILLAQNTEDAKEMLIEIVKPENDVLISKNIDEKPKESHEKRTKKKKKKILKQNTSSELNSSANLNVADDSYDFLLETSILDESADRTNIEMSQELDKMIQRGMYTNLEEKIKSLNISTNDSFFKTIINNISSREPSVEKNGFNQTPDFSKILNNTSYLLKSQSLVVNPDNTKPNNFLDKPPSQKLMREDKIKEHEIANETENLYPITKAVKEWMTKTRETTPDVEILKSPSTIYREFGMDERKNGDKLLLPTEMPNEDVEIDDEITIYSLHKEDNVDLLECWEDETSPEMSKKNSSASLVEEGEDVLEIYDSKYGKNEDFLNIQKEIGEKKMSGNFPKHGNLPYRAICCSIM